MSTDGVNIIDGDTARDTYWAIMDLYDSGATRETIRTKMPFPQTDYHDDFDYEVYATAYALAIWETGFMTDDILQEIKRVIHKGACVKVWTDSYGPVFGKRRQKVLDKLWAKITTANTRIRTRKKYKSIKQLLFSINDVFSFQADDTNYYAIILLDVIQYRGQCDYRFGIIQYQDKRLPAMSDIENGTIAGRKIPFVTGPDLAAIFSMSMDEKLRHGGIEPLLNNQADRTGSYDIGMTMVEVNHKVLINFSDRFIKIGHFDLIEECRKMGSLRLATTFDELIEGYHTRYAEDIKSGTFQIHDLLKVEREH
jgi:hypothetical protein